MSLQKFALLASILSSLATTAWSQDKASLQAVLMSMPEEVHLPSFVYSDSILDSDLSETTKLRQFLFGVSYIPDSASVFAELSVADSSPEEFIKQAQSLMSNMTPRELFPVVHAAEFASGREEFIENSLQYHPRYTEGRLRRAPPEEKRRRAGRSYDHGVRMILRDDLNSTIAEEIVDIVGFSPRLVKYLNDAVSSEMAEVLSKAQTYHALVAETAAIEAETAAIEAEMKASEERMRATLQRIADDIVERRRGLSASGE